MAGIRQRMSETRAWLYDRDAQPDFKQIVEKSLALFGVFTGVTLSFYIKDFLFGDKIPLGFRDFSLWERGLMTASVISLLLRYIVGSAVHLTATYVPKVTTTIQEIGGKQVLFEEKKSRSASLFWLCFDIVVLVAFGMVAVLIIYSSDFGEFLRHSGYFIALGLLWNVVALFCRPDDRAVAERWWWIDMWQLIITIALMVPSGLVLERTIVLAVVYVSFLFLDFCVVSRPPPPEPPVPVKADVKAVLERVLTWPSERQEDAAKLLLLMESQDESAYRLTDEQVEEVRRRTADPNCKLVHGEPDEAP